MLALDLLWNVTKLSLMVCFRVDEVLCTPGKILAQNGLSATLHTIPVEILVVRFDRDIH